MASSDYQQYLNFAQSVALDAGDIMLDYFKIGVVTEDKTDGTPVTIADKAVNRLLVDRVQSTFPTHSVLGEEESESHQNSAYTWVCDPIDGTPMYAAGLPVNVFALALVDASDGQPVVAVINDPYMKRVYSAIVGNGAFVNDHELRVNDIATLAKSTISTTADRSEIVDVHKLKAAIIEKSYRNRAMGSVLYEAMVVATGHFSAQVFLGWGAHDVAAAKLIVEEAGGKVTDLFGNEQRFDQKIQGAIISNGLIHDDLVALAKQFRR